jgi:chemotaxis protein CheZ
VEQNATIHNIDQQTGDDPAASVAHNMATLLGQISQMETFIKRRFDEISMEINATSQQIDMSEDGMAKRFGEIMGIINAISFSGDGTTPANTGVELEAVIADTSKAANTILDNCDVLNELLYPEDNFVFENAEAREEWLGKLRDGVQSIMVACSFQDIAGQRIRKTLDSISDIEDRITGALEQMGVGPETIKAAAQTTSKDAVKSGSSQDDIDALFS